MRGLARMDDARPVRDPAFRQRLGESILYSIGDDRGRVVGFVRLAAGPGPGPARHPLRGRIPRVPTLEGLANSTPCPAGNGLRGGVRALYADGQREALIAMAAPPWRRSSSVAPPRKATRIEGRPERRRRRSSRLRSTGRLP